MNSGIPFPPTGQPQPGHLSTQESLLLSQTHLGHLHHLDLHQLPSSMHIPPFIGSIPSGIPSGVPSSQRNVGVGMPNGFNVNLARFMAQQPHGFPFFPYAGHYPFLLAAAAHQAHQAMGMALANSVSSGGKQISPQHQIGSSPPMISPASSSSQVSTFF